MSRWEKAKKSVRRPYRERGQLTERKQFGLLEKHKDYVLRARDYHRKQARLKLMHEKARNKNPDEFYYKMVNTKLKDGRHVIPQTEEKYTPEEMALMKTQDLKYVQLKLSTETKKIERLQSGLHLLNDKNELLNKHTVFVDSPEDVSAFDSTQYFQTTPELVGRAYNRVTAEQLSNKDKAGQSSKVLSIDTIKELNHECAKQYWELDSRIQRHKELKRIAQKMQTKKELAGKGHRLKMPGDGINPCTYKWRRERKK